MLTTKRNLLVFVSTLLSLCVLLQTCWIVNLQRQVEQLHTGNYTNTIIMVDETIQRIDSYLETRDPSLLPNLHVRMRIMGQEMVQLAHSVDDSDLYPSTTEHGTARPDGVVEKMIKDKVDTDTIAAHLQQVRECLQEFRQRGRMATDYDENAKEALMLWRDLVVLANNTNRQLQYL